MFVGPLELFRPEAATRSFGNYIWLFLLLFYWLWLLLVVLLARPRLVVYNISTEELHPVLAEAAARLDPAARWAGNHLSLPGLGVQLHLDSFDLMRNVSLVSSGSRQNIDGWRRLARAGAGAAQGSREVESAGDRVSGGVARAAGDQRDAPAESPGCAGAGDERGVCVLRVRGLGGFPG